MYFKGKVIQFPVERMQSYSEQDEPKDVQADSFEQQTEAPLAQAVGASAPLFFDLSHFATRREEKASQLEYRLQRTKDKYAISSGKNKALSSVVASNVIKKDDILNKKIEVKNKDIIIEQYRKGQLTYDDVDNYIEQLDTTYGTLTNTAINVLTGICAMTAGISARAVKQDSVNMPVVMAVSVLAGAVAKVGLSILERSRNNIKGDEFDGKQIAKDALGGAVNGAFSGFGAGVGRQITGAYLGRKAGFEVSKQGILIGLTKGFQKKRAEKSNKIAY